MTEKKNEDPYLSFPIGWYKNAISFHVYDKVQDQGIRAMSVGDQIEVAPNKLLCIAQFHSWPQMTFAKKMNAKSLFLGKI